ncbi:hypothetical protein [Chryseobacterium sp. FH1]|uniref:hypothetical protein n=1 Tax=Chryseobacterium sp. FH1 TaxID=1233951 RepID=UPI0004E447D4|nr:hypothetical protein [Chryseobacterium sp. FH1]KFC19675.1 hypothetical protein IO90_10405 [Chryseobacterium sp. FH1]
MPNGTTPVIARRYYPTLSSVITKEDIPEILGFLKEGLQNLLDKIHYKDLQYSKSPTGDAAFYSLSLVTPNRLDIELPGTGIYLVLNPDITGGDSHISAFPITVEYQWKILAYLRAFSIDSFSFSPQQIFEVALRILNISEEQAIANFINLFVVPIDDNTTALEQFVTDINDLTDLNLPAPTEDTTITQIVMEMFSQSSGQYASVIALGAYISVDPNQALDKLKIYFKSFLPENIDDYIKEILIPKFRATLTLIAGIEFPRNMLIPVYPEGTIINNTDVSYEPIPVTNPNAPIKDQEPKALFTFAEALFYADTTQGFGYNMDIVINTITPVQIGNTGLIVNIHNLKIDLSTKTNFPEADVDGRPPEFMGVYTEQTDIVLPKKWFSKDSNISQTLKISGKHLLIGTGGVSGTIALEAINTGNPPGQTDFFWVNLGKDEATAWKLGFNSFDIAFSQGDIVSSNIRARLEIPTFTDDDGDEAMIDVVGHIERNGDFLLTASAVPPFNPTITFLNVFKLHLNSIELGKEGDEFFIGATADLEFIDDFLGGLLEGQAITISALRIYSSGRIDFRVNGGNLTLPKPVKLKIGPTELSVTAIHFGSHEREYKGKVRKYNYFGFDGGISIGLAGVDARGDGIKYYYTIDDDLSEDKGPDSYLHIQTIFVDMVIPANSSDPSVAIKGWLTIPEPGAFQEYQGGVDLKIKNPRINGKVDMRLAPKYPGFLIDAAIELPNPIALGPISIYGFRGLLGYRYVAEKKAIGMNENNSWYEYYTAPQRGVNVHKFSRPDQTENYGFPFSLGVGAILGDTMAAGNIISANAMLLLSLPSMIMVDARMKLLDQRVSFSDDPPFFAFFIFGDNSLEFGFGADYKFPDSGAIIKLYAEIQAGFFFNNPSNWYINFGTEQKPITAKLLMEIFTLKSYLMISGKGIKAGARGEFRFDRKYGPVKIFVLAYLELGGKVSFQKPQMGAYIEAGLAIDINVKIFRIYASVTILLAVESPQPFLIYGAFMVEFKIKVLFFKIKFKAKLELKWEFNSKVDRDPINPFTEIRDQRGSLVKGVSMLTNETFDLKEFEDPDILDTNPRAAAESIDKVIPLDTYIDIKTTKGLLPNLVDNIIGGYTSPADLYTDMVPPEKVMRGLELRQVKHQYTLEGIDIRAYSTTARKWIKYNPYVALYPNDTENSFGALKVGQWQKKDNQYNAIRILATTPFSYTEQGIPGWYVPEQYGVLSSTLFCQGQNIESSVSDFLDKEMNTKYYASSSNYFHSKKASYQLQGDVQYIVNPDGSVTMQGDYAEVTNETNFFTFDKSLKFPNNAPLIIMLPNPSLEVELRLSTYSSGVWVTMFAKDLDSTVYDPQYERIFSEYRTKDDLTTAIRYEDTDTQMGITKIVITPDTPDYDTISQIEQQMAVLMDEGYQNALAEGGEIIEIIPSNPRLYNNLSRTLRQLKAVGCEGVSQELFPEVCGFYMEMISYYNNYFNEMYAFHDFFIPEPGPEERKEIYAEFIKNNLGRYWYAYSVISANDITPIYDKNVELYRTYYNILADYIGQHPVNFDGIISRFEILKAKFEQILSWLQSARPCEDQILCDLGQYLSHQDFGHFYDRPPVSRSPLLESYYIFVSQNPRYNYLDLVLERQINFIQNIIDQGWVIYSQNEENYKKACEALIQIIVDLGNCKPEHKCFTLLHDINWLSVEDFTYNEQIPGLEVIDEDVQATLDAISKSIQPIWRPDTKYYVKFTLRDMVDNVGNNNQVFHQAYGFRTAGPLGFFHLDDQSDYGDRIVPNSTHTLKDAVGKIVDSEQNLVENTTAHPDLYPHTNLRSYIDYERSYPNADGNIVNAKPLFYGDDTTKISLYFNKTYVQKLLEGWEAMKDPEDPSMVALPEVGGIMKIIIKDPVEGVEISNPPSLDNTVVDIDVPQTIESWDEDDDPPLPAIYQQYFNMLLNSECHGSIQLVKPKSTYRTVTPKLLKPQKLYTAQVLNFYWGNNELDLSNITEDDKLRYAKEVHKFVFQTSRYMNFREQVTSCYKEYQDENNETQSKMAVYEIHQSIDASRIQAAFDMLRGISNQMSEEISSQYPDLFDRIMEGIFRISPLANAETTEFNKIIDTVTGKIIALLVRNPEPFNHPKIPLAQISRNDRDAGMIEVMIPPLRPGARPTINRNYHALYSKDYAKAIIMHNDMFISETALRFQFIFKIWDGSKYEQKDEVTTRINLI